MKIFERRALAPEYRQLLRLLTWLWTGLITIPVFILTYFAIDLVWYSALVITFCTWLLLALLLKAYVMAWYKKYQYALSKEGLIINKGVFWQQLIIIPRNRVQHTDITTGPLERRYNLAKLVVHTAGTRDASVTLNGLPEKTAADLRKELIISIQDDSV